MTLLLMLLLLRSSLLAKLIWAAEFRHAIHFVQQVLVVLAFQFFLLTHDTAALESMLD